MQPRTQRFVATADENEAVARTIHVIDQPGMTRWSIVAAFYAAVHDVNGYLWETLRVEPRTHGDRWAMVAAVSALRDARESYLRLQTYAYDARYRPRFQIAHNVATRLIERGLVIVRSTIARALPDDS